MIITSFMIRAQNVSIQFDNADFDFCHQATITVTLTGLTPNTNYAADVPSYIQPFQFLENAGFGNMVFPDQIAHFAKQFNSGNSTTKTFVFEVKPYLYFVPPPATYPVRMGWNPTNPSTNEIPFRVELLTSSYSYITHSVVNFKWLFGEQVYAIPDGTELSQNPEFFDGWGSSSCSPYSFYVEGDFIVDEDFCFQNNGANNTHLIMNKNARIIVTSGHTLTLNGIITFGGCSEGSWESITVQPGAKLIVSEGVGSYKPRSIFKNAIIAIYAEGSGTINVDRTDFEDNYIGIDMNPANNAQNVDISIRNSTFRGISTLYPATFTNQTDIFNNSQPYCGVILRNNTNLINSSEFFNNRFENMENGMICINTEMDIISNKFSNITNKYPASNQIKGTGIYIMGKGITKFEYNGSDNQSAPDMLNCDYGIITERADAELKDVYMTAINKTGLLVKNSLMNNVGFTSSYIDSKYNAVSLFNTSFSNVGIKENILSVTDGTSPGASVVSNVNNNFMAGNYPEGVLVESNTITANGDAVGIRSSYNTFTSIKNNIIRTQSQSKGDGVVLENDFGTVVSCNQFLQNGTTDNKPAAGIFNKTAAFSFIQCNEMNDFPKGMEFFGPNLDDIIKGNEFNNHNVGLLYDHEAVTGEQKWNGNTWNDTYAWYGAVHTSGDNNLIQLSEYRVDSGNFPTHGTTVYTANISADWFIINSQNYSFQCSPESSCLFGAPQIFGSTPNRDSLNLAISNDSLHSTVYPGSYAWMAKRQLYSSFLQWPGSLQEHADYQSFYNTYSNQSVGKFASIENKIRFGGVPTYNQIQSLASYRTTQDNMVRLLDSLENMPVLNLPAISQAYTYLNTTKQNAGQIIQGIYLSRDTVLQTQQSENTAINTSNNYESNQKTANNLLLKALALGIANLDSTEISQLEDIAEQCPLEGGEGVYTARSILVQIGEYDYNDRDLCEIVEEREIKTKDLGLNSGFYPNPASNEIILILPEDKVCQKISISNNLGQVLLIEKSPVTGQAINLSNFANGIYILEFEYKDGIEGKKVIKN